MLVPVMQWRADEMEVIEMPKRERIDTTPGQAGGSRFVRRDGAGQFTKDQVNAGKSIAQDRRVKAKNAAPKGQKDRGD